MTWKLMFILGLLILILTGIFYISFDLSNHKRPTEVFNIARSQGNASDGAPNNELNIGVEPHG